MNRLTSGAMPRHSLELPTTPATNVPWPIISFGLFWPVQSTRSITFLKCSWFSSRPVSNMATLTFWPVKPFFHRCRTLSWSTICLGMARNIFRFLNLPLPATGMSSSSTDSSNTFLLVFGGFLSELSLICRINYLCFNKVDQIMSVCFFLPNWFRVLLMRFWGVTLLMWGFLRISSSKLSKLELVCGKFRNQKLILLA